MEVDKAVNISDIPILAFAETKECKQLFLAA